MSLKQSIISQGVQVSHVKGFLCTGMCTGGLIHTALGSIESVGLNASVSGKGSLMHSIASESEFLIFGES